MKTGSPEAQLASAHLGHGGQALVSGSAAVE